MILIGPAELIPLMVTYGYNDNMVFYNLTSLREDIPKINILPPVNTMYMNEKEFDFYFNNYIFENDKVFLEFFDKIMMPIYNGAHVFLVVDNREGSIFQMVSSSLAKIIQCRYGYHISFVNTLEDLEYVNKDESFTTVEGISRFDYDKERWTGMKASKMQLKEIVGSTHMDGIGYMDTYGIF